jgi:MHS family proline/betaine transporter-like MFS transporter
MTTSASIEKKAVRRAIVAAGIGNYVEWFDFALYGYLATIISKEFFPNEDPTAAMLSTFAVFGVAFLVRPVGAVFFGRLGDRMGRKTTLSTVVILMSIGSAAIGILPTYSQVGILAPMLLLLCRLVQGFSAGGEYTGASAFVFEYSPEKRRGLFASSLSMTTYLGLLSGSGLTAVLTTLLGDTAMQDFGWRLPFLLSLPMGLIGLYLRLRVEETPVFKQLKLTQEVEHSPLREVFRTQRGKVGLLFVAAAINATTFYVLGTYWTTFLTKEAGVPHSIALWSSAGAYALLICLVPLFGIISDRIGRKPMWLFSTAGLVVVSLPAFALSGQGGFLPAFLGQALFVLVAGWMSPGITLLNAELFPARLRYSASGIGYNLGYAVFGGTAPFVATFLVAQTGSLQAPPIYIMCLALVAFIILAVKLPETAPRKTHTPETDSSASEEMLRPHVELGKRAD